MFLFLFYGVDLGGRRYLKEYPHSSTQLFRNRWRSPIQENTRCSDVCKRRDCDLRHHKRGKETTMQSLEDVTFQVFFFFKRKKKLIDYRCVVTSVFFVCFLTLWWNRKAPVWLKIVHIIINVNRWRIKNRSMIGGMIRNCDRGQQNVRRWIAYEWILGALRKRWK